MSSLKKIKIMYSILAVIFIIFGICLMIRPELSLRIICRLAGVLFLIYGFVKISGYFSRDIYELAFQFDFAMGLFSLAIGCALSFLLTESSLSFPPLWGL